MMPKLFQKNIFKILSIEFFSIIFICGFLIPKFHIIGFYISISDILACIFTFLLLFKLKYIDFDILSIFVLEILASLFTILLLIFNYAINNIDSYSYLYTIRILIYILASIYIIKNDSISGVKVIYRSIYIISTYILFYIILIIINIWQYSMDEILYGYTFIRLKLPFEYSGTTSVPFAYLLSLVFAYLSSTKKSHAVIYFIAQLLSMSRAAVLSSSIIYTLKYKKYGYLIFILTIIFILYKTLLSDGIDHSSHDRVMFFIYSIEYYFNNFPKSFFGFGLSPSILYSNTGYFYYENIFSQTLMSGGILYFAISISIYILFSYRIFFLKKYIYIPVLVGNFLGGFNLFSTISLPLYFMLVYYYDDK